MPKIKFMFESNFAEQRAITHAALITDTALTFNCGAVPNKQLLLLGAIPVGGVPFLQQCMRLTGITEPPSLTYPTSLRKFLHRHCAKTTLGAVNYRSFIKPVVPKLFTGFVYDPSCDPKQLSEHDRQQLDALQSLPNTEQVWVADVVEWASEVRYYVLNGNILGSARYDDGPDSVRLPDDRIVAQMLERVQADSSKFPIAFAMDIGVLATGETALVECNDAWALGFYPWGTLSSVDYSRLLAARWEELTAGVLPIPATNYADC